MQSRQIDRSELAALYADYLVRESEAGREPLDEGRA